MTNAEMRAAIAAAVSEVEGLTGYPKRPGSINAGDAWPLWRGAARGDDHMAFTNSWMVVLALPGDEDEADVWIDRYGVDLFVALSPLLFITAVDPALLPMSGTDTYALQITGITE
jgi:hypothetical protein